MVKNYRTYFVNFCQLSDQRVAISGELLHVKNS